MKLPPEVAISDLESLFRRLAQYQATLRKEAATVAEQWVQLGRLGGQRADHAASLLGKLRPHLEALRDFCARSAEQIVDWESAPFTE